MGRVGCVRVCWVLVLLWVLGAAAAAEDGAEPAEATSSLSVQQFLPASGGSENYTHVVGVQTLGAWRPALGLVTNYAYRPLVLSTLDGSESVDLIRDHLQADLLAALGVGDSLQLGLALPVTLYQVAGEAGALEPAALSAQTLGDLRLGARWQAFGKGKTLALGLAAGVTLPTGNASSFQGEPTITFEPKLLIELNLGRHFRTGLNLGYLLREAQTFESLTIGNELTYGLGAAYELTSSLALLAEGFGRASADPALDLSAERLPFEANLGLRLRLGQSHLISFGMGPGLQQGYGTPVFRAFLGYSFVGAARKQGGASLPAEDYVDAVDRGAVAEAEAPEPRLEPVPCDTSIFGSDCGAVADGDGDGIPDPEDACPEQAEDRDYFQDEDGCPELDNDQDGIPDGEDGCPNDPETRNGVQDGDGCPEKDIDNDGVPDSIDKCQFQAENYNGVDDEDGCPDADRATEPEGPAVIAHPDQTFKVLVFFDSDAWTLDARTYDVLRRVERYMKENPAVFLRVLGFADNTGRERPSLRVSQMRALRIKYYLVDHEIEAERIEIRHFGSRLPRSANDTEAGRADNRRVRIVPMEADGKPVQQLPDYLYVPLPEFASRE